MKYLIINLSIESNSVIEDKIDNSILKDIPYGSKIKKPNLSYNNILIPLIDTSNINLEENADFKLKEGLIYNHCVYNSKINQDVIYSIYKVFNPVLEIQKSIAFDLVLILNDESNFEILYSDGSSSSKNNSAGYGVCKLLEESEDGVFDDFTKKNWTFTTISGRIENGTNNIGELTGLKTAFENFGEKPVKIIISDSEYSIKTFREYIHVWKNNGWLAYNKKPIKNKELIQEAYSKYLEQAKNSLILFKWVKGHDNDSFNSICDELAKKESGAK